MNEAEERIELNNSKSSSPYFGDLKSTSAKKIDFIRKILSYHN
jgi:hypothetical protein